MLWFKDSELINDSTRGGIRVVSEQQMKTSNLVISRVTHTDSGNYTCAADNSSKYNWHIFFFSLFWFFKVFPNTCKWHFAYLEIVCVCFFFFWFSFSIFVDSDSVFVHIINSEKHAAMQHELASRLHIPRSLLVILTFFYVSM